MARIRPPLENDPDFTADHFWATIDAAWTEADSNRPDLTLTNRTSVWDIRQNHNPTMSAVDARMVRLLQILERNLRRLDFFQLRSWNAHLNDTLHAVIGKSPYHDGEDIELFVHHRRNDPEFYMCCLAIAAGERFYNMYKTNPGGLQFRSTKGAGIFMAPVNWPGAVIVPVRLCLGRFSGEPSAEQWAEITCAVRTVK